MFERPILFYSDYCTHSKNFINLLSNHESLFNEFIRINIDKNPETKQRPNVFYNIQHQLGVQITEIPTIITHEAESILTGIDAFDWLEYQISPQNHESIQGFNNIEMGSFSDSYSTYGSNDLNDAKQQTFKFLGADDDRIETPPETDTHISSDEYSRKQQERENFDNIHYNSPQNGGGRSQNGGRAKSNTKMNKASDTSQKQKEIDLKLQQMLMERETFGNAIQRR